MKREFVSLSPLGALALFAAGFLLAEAIEDLRQGLTSSPEFFVAIMFALVVREDAKEPMADGRYRRRWFVYRAQEAPPHKEAP